MTPLPIDSDHFKKLVIIARELFTSYADRGRDPPITEQELRYLEKLVDKHSEVFLQHFPVELVEPYGSLIEKLDVAYPVPTEILELAEQVTATYHGGLKDQWARKDDNALYHLSLNKIAKQHGFCLTLSGLQKTLLWPPEPAETAAGLVRQRVYRAPEEWAYSPFPNRSFKHSNDDDDSTPECAHGTATQSDEQEDTAPDPSKQQAAGISSDAKDEIPGSPPYQLCVLGDLPTSHKWGGMAPMIVHFMASLKFPGINRQDMHKELTAAAHPNARFADMEKALREYLRS